MYVASGFAASMMPESVYAAAPDLDNMLNDSNIIMNLTILGLASLALIPNAVYQFYDRAQRKYDERFFLLFADYLGDAVSIMPVKRLETRIAASEKAYMKELENY